MRKALLILVACATVIAASAAPVGSHPGTRPFAARLSGAASFVPVDQSVCPIGLRTESSARGVAVHMGATTMHARHCTPPGPDITGGTLTLIAANGDKLYLEYEGTGYLDPSTAEIGDVFPVVDQFEIVGGTGRFDDATGGGTGLHWIVFEGFGDPEWAGTWFYVGEIAY